MKETDDSSLIQRCLNPDTANFAYAELVKCYQSVLYKHIRRMVIDHDDADDLLQETFVKAWQNLHRFEGKSKLKTWLYTIASNVCITFLNKKKQRFFLPIVDVSGELTRKLSQNQDLVDGDEIQLKFQAALLKLPEKQRLVFNMKYFDELTYEEIAEITGVSVGGLKANYHHAVKKIEDILKTN